MIDSKPRPHVLQLLDFDPHLHNIDEVTNHHASAAQVRHQVRAGVYLSLSSPAGAARAQHQLTFKMACGGFVCSRYTLCALNILYMVSIKCRNNRFFWKEVLFGYEVRFCFEFQTFSFIGGAWQCALFVTEAFQYTCLDIMYK